MTPNVTLNSVKKSSSLVRARFEPGMLLQAEDLAAQTAYTRELSRLLFRSFFGCGVVCGLVVKVVENCGRLEITVEAGLAMNCSGDPIHVPTTQAVVIDPNCDPELTGPLWVLLCATARSCAPRTSMCPSDDDETPSVSTRERDMFEIRIVSGDRPASVCGCTVPDGWKLPEENACRCADPTLPCHVDHYAGICGCACEGDQAECDCECIVLAKLAKTSPRLPWSADHRWRRFIRPVLMRDPQVQRERTAPAAAMETTVSSLINELEGGKKLEVGTGKLNRTVVRKSGLSEERKRIILPGDAEPVPETPKPKGRPR